MWYVHLIYYTAPAICAFNVPFSHGLRLSDSVISSLPIPRRALPPPGNSRLRPLLEPRRMASSPPPPPPLARPFLNVIRILYRSHLYNPYACCISIAILSYVLSLNMRAALQYYIHAYSISCALVRGMAGHWAITEAANSQICKSTNRANFAEASQTLRAKICKLCRDVPNPQILQSLRDIFS